MVIQISEESVCGDKIAWLYVFFQDIALHPGKPAGAVGYEADIIQHFMRIG